VVCKQSHRTVRAKTGAGFHQIEDSPFERSVGITEEIATTEGDRRATLGAPEWREIREPVELVEVDKRHRDLSDEAARMRTRTLMNDGAFIEC
jgi:hypothetical protein